LFATADSATKGQLDAVVPNGYEENTAIDVKVAECLHISNFFEKAYRFDIIHNHFDFFPLAFSSFIETPLVTTIHGFSSPAIVPVYKKYDQKTYYVSISDADRSPELQYIRTIHHGIRIDQFPYCSNPDGYLLFYGRFHHDKGAREAIEIAHRAGRKLVMAGIIQDEAYYRKYVAPHIDGTNVEYIGAVGADRRGELLKRAYALLHPIHFNEPFGLSVVEAMACGTPTIAFNRGSMPELITHKVNGFLVGDIDSAVSVIENIPLIDRSQCRKIAEQRFSVERMADEYINVYNKIISQFPKNDPGAWEYHSIAHLERNVVFLL
jgi:glycosyltransferase involved in cell wall biosynthesis